MHFVNSKVRKLNIMLIGVVLGLLLVVGSVSAETIVLGDFSWDSVQVHNRIAGFILEHGYGYDVEYQFGETIPILLGLRRGDVDASMEFWIDNIYDAVLEAIDAEEIISLGTNYPDAPQGWYVPTYVIEGDAERGIEPVAPNLRTVDDLKDYTDIFQDPVERDKGRFYNAPTGWVAHDINNDKIEAYGLDEYYTSFNTGSDAGLSTAIIRAYDRGEPIVAYNWEPNWVIGLLDMTLLEEPEYNEAQWSENHGTAYPASEVHVFVTADLPSRAPRAIELFANYQTTLAENNEFLAYMQEENASVEEAALWFLDNNRETWHKWIIDREVVDRVTSALEEELN